MLPYERPRGTIHDLAALATLNENPCRLLCVSDRTLYVLQNLAALDVTFPVRYATDLLEGGYVPVKEEDGPLWDLFRSVVNGVQLEVLDMSCDIETGLTAIADSLSELAEAQRIGGGGGGCPNYGVPVLNCIVDLTNEDLFGPPDSTQGDPDVDPPPEGFATWEEYFTYKCQAAHFIWELERKNMVMIKNFEGVALVASIVGPSAAGILGVLPAAMTPAGWILFVGSIVAIGVVAAASFVYMDQMIDWWDLNKQTIICSLYNSGSSVEAVTALSGLLEDAIQAIVAWGVLGPVAGEISGLLSTAFSQLAGNGIVEPLFKTIVAATQFEYDCAPCEDPSGDLFQTALSSPFNQLIVGDSIEFSAEDPTQGYRDQNSGQDLFIIWQQSGTAVTWSWEAESGCFDHGPGADINWQMHLTQSADGINWSGTVDFQAGTYPREQWNYLGPHERSYQLNDGTWYRIQLTCQEFNFFTWWRKIQGITLT